MGSSITMILLYFLLLGHAAADSGDDFSNNLFTDLSPQAMGLSDCIILAMAPLGIITIIVAAIRVSGPPWLKALIGRATENLAAAELELMSSTSNEVCELWNGNDVVRCAGSASVWEFICLLPSNGEGKLPENPEIEIMSLEDAEKDSNLYMKRWHGVKESNQMNKVIIIRNTIPNHMVPNISHNRYKNTGRRELYLAACFGVLLQISVLLYCGVITQFSRAASKFQKDGNPVGGYAFPLTMIGTVILNLGMLICCRVVETSTEEIAFQPTEGWRARMVWLQREKTVGDQEFKSFALFTREDQPTIITSSRKNESKESQKRFLEIMTVVGTVTSLVGFFAQFVGIRGMHWSVSVASLIAVLLMTAIRAWVRRGLTRPMHSEHLRPGYELDWFADTLKDIGGATWYEKQNGSENETSSSTTQSAKSGETQKCTERRQELANLTGYQGPASKEATAVKLATEGMMNLLYKDREEKGFSWLYNVQGSQKIEDRIPFKITRRNDGKWTANIKEIEAALSLRLFYVNQEEKTESPANNTDSSSGDEEQIPVKRETRIRVLGPNTIKLLRHLSWWIPADGPQIRKGRVGSILPKEGQIGGSENIQVNDTSRIATGSTGFNVHQSKTWNSGRSEEESEPSKFFKASEADNGLLLIKSRDPLENLYAKDMFSAFMWAVMNSLEHPIKGNTDILVSQVISDNEEDTWRSLTLRNDGITQSAQAIQDSGLCNLHESYISIISPFCHLNAFKAESYSYIRAIAALVAFRKALRKANSEPDLAQRLMENADIDLGHNLDLLCEFQGTDDDVRFVSDHHNLFYLAERYRNLTEDCSVPREHEAEEKAKVEANEAKAKDILDRTPLHYCAVFSHHSTFGSENKNDAQVPLEEAIYKPYIRRTRQLIDNGTDINGRDICGWTPLHYACHIGKTSMHVARLLLEKGASADVRGRDGTAPIHCAADGGHLNMIEILLEFRANVDILDGSGSTALHIAALKGSAEVFRLLCSQGRIIRDKQGRTAIHIAAMVGFTAAIEYWDHDVDCKDYDDKTPLHFAVEFGHRDFVQKLLGLSQVNINATSAEEKCTALHIACGKGHDEIVGILLDKGADIEAVNARGETPLLDAIRNQRQSTIKLLTARGAKLATALKVAKEGKEVNYGEGTWEGTPLHWASDGNNPMIRHLINLGAKINATDIRGRTPLHYAVLNNKSTNIQLLANVGADIEARADLEARDWYGRTPLQLSVSSYYSNPIERQECIGLLIKLGALVNASDSWGSTVLHTVVTEEALTDLIPELLEAGADIEKVDEEGCTPLHLAAVYGCSKATKILLEHGANAEALNNEEKTPRMMNPEWWGRNIPPSTAWWSVSAT
ncbi:ankyrin repeat-containing domain protein [Trichoderma afarasin]